VDLSEVAKDIAAELQKRQPERQVEFVIAEEVTADGDPEMLRVVMENLLSNAWKFTGKRAIARVEFGVTSKDDKPVYFVRDDGAGFEMAYVDKLFGAFQRLHRATEFPGLGIGLATIQRIIHRHGGFTWAEGEVEKGATFYFTLSS
jgi:light-regulated signal transduction histidine kinase (bacteriophytochrome)